MKKMTQAEAELRAAIERDERRLRELEAFPPEPVRTLHARLVRRRLTGNKKALDKLSRNKAEAPGE